MNRYRDRCTYIAHFLYLDIDVTMINLLLLVFCLQGLVAVITGGTGTLGRPMAEAMAAAGLPFFFVFVAVVFLFFLPAPFLCARFSLELLISYLHN